MTTTASAPTSAACAARATVSAVVCAPHCTATWRRLSAACRNRSAARRRSPAESRIPSPAVPSARIPSSPAADEEVDERGKASSSSSPPAFPKRRHGRGQGAAQRRAHRGARPSRTRSTVPAMRRGAGLGTLGLLDPLDVLAAVREGQRGERLATAGPPRAQPGGRTARAPCAAPCRAPSRPAPGRPRPPRGRLHRAVHDDVPDAAVDTRRRPPGVAANRDLHRRPRTSERLLEVERHAEHRRRLLHPLELDQEALRGHSRNHMVSAMAALHVERDGDVLRVTLARPERRNAFDAALIAELTGAFADVGDARAVVLSGEGPSFCAGADVEWQRAAIDLSYDENVEDAMRLYRMLEAIDGCPAPVVCVVHGHALGGGSASSPARTSPSPGPDAVFGFTEVRLGIIPAVISPFVLPRIGDAARRYFLTGERFGRGRGAPDRPRAGGLEDAGRAAEAIVESRARAGPRRCGRRSASSASAPRASTRRTSPPPGGRATRGARRDGEASTRKGCGASTRGTSPREDDRRRGARRPW